MELFQKSLDMITALFKVPFKIVIIILNIIPVSVFELVPPPTALNTRNPESVRLYKTVQKGRRLHLGFTLIAYLNGSIIVSRLQNKTKIRGVWPEDYESIKRAWGL